MARTTSLTVRKLSTDTKDRLVKRARRHKRSLEAEVRALLEAAAYAPEQEPEGLPFPDWLIAMAPPEEPGEPSLSDYVEESRRHPHMPPALWLDDEE
ncbi:MAG: hypothetical protein ABUL55_02575 [Pseudomonadota bacterium]